MDPKYNRIIQLSCPNPGQLQKGSPKINRRARWFLSEVEGPVRLLTEAYTNPQGSGDIS
jgi:hypothetical protein